MADINKPSIHINPADTRISEDGLRLIKEWVLKKIGKVSADLKYTADLVVPSVDQLPEEGNPEYVYMVGPLPDSIDSDGMYDVYTWIAGEYEKLTTLNNSMVGFWKGATTVEGEGNAVTGIELSDDGNTVVVSKGETFATTAELPTVMTGASDTAPGVSGLVPAPSSGDTGKYLRGDGSWVTPPPSSTYAYDEESETLTITVN